jgi:phage protein D
LEFSKLQKQYQDFYVPNFTVAVEGEDILKKSVEVFNVSVNNTLEGADDFSFTVNNPYDPDAENFPYLQEGGLFEVGKKVEIKMGYVDKKRLNTLLVGLITSIDVSFPANGISQLVVKGFDLSHPMMKEKHSENWGSSDQPVKYSDIVKKLAGQKYNLKTSNVVDTGEKHRQLKQDRESDYEFIKNKLAEKIGFEFFVFKDDLFFRPPANDKKDMVTTLEWGKTLINFSPQLNIANQVTEVQVRGWDPSKQKPIIGKASKGDEHGRDGKRKSGAEKIEESQGSVIRHFWKPVSSKKEAENLAKSLLDRLSEDLVTGSGECIGLPDILPGNNIKLSGLGRFSKSYYIEKSTHSMSSSGYKTTFGVKENTI